MSNECKNCGEEFEGKYCSSCGAKAGEKALSSKDEALALLKETAETVKQLKKESEERKAAIQKAKEQREKEGGRKSTKRNRGILDIF